MAIFTVHVPPGFDTAEERADHTAFVRDGFNVWAFLFGPLFLLRHRAWLAALLWLAAVLAWAWVSRVLHLPGAVGTGLALVLALFLGLEGNGLRRAALQRRGFDFADVVAGRRRDEGELKFFGKETEPRPAVAPQPAGRVEPSRAPGPVEVIGFFPEPER